MLRKCRIQVEDFGEVRTSPGLLFLEVLNREGLDLHNDCGGQGKCGKCRIVFHSDAPECTPGDLRHLSKEEIEAGVRLACFQQVRYDCKITIPPAPTCELLDDL